MILTAVAINLKRLAASLGRRRTQANAVARRAENACFSPFSTLVCLRTILTGLWASITEILTPLVLDRSGAVALG